MIPIHSINQIESKAKNSFQFITETIQRGRIRPAKFIHSLEIPKYIYDELILYGILKPENYYIYESAFFEYRHERVIISFVNRGLCDDLQFAIDRYLIKEFCGKYPIERKYQSKMNKDSKLKNWNKGVETKSIVNQVLNKVNRRG
jgi:hypothetical protein